MKAIKKDHFVNLGPATQDVCVYSWMKEGYRILIYIQASYLKVTPRFFGHQKTKTQLTGNILYDLLDKHCVISVHKGQSYLIILQQQNVPYKLDSTGCTSSVPIGQFYIILSVRVCL